MRTPLFTLSRPILLASQSQQRKMLLDAAGIPFIVKPANIDEQAIRHSDPRKMTKEVAAAKAQEVIAHGKIPASAIVLAADTVMLVGKQLLEKPKSKVEAKKMLQLQSGNWVESITGFVFAVPELDVLKKTAVVSRAKFRELSDVEIDHYVANHAVTTWCGGFSPAYPAGANLIEKIEGSLTSLTHGLPMEKVFPALNQYAQKA